jgi:PTH1 family peptidyl-tRNA hydrolase
MDRPPDSAAPAGDRFATQADSRRDSPASQSEPTRGIELVVGLGNPGAAYAATRHNLGFLVVDELARRHAADRWARLPLCELTSARFGARLLLAKPLTYMNRSGAALAWLLDHLELDLRQALVVLDDVDLGLGVVRMRRSGSAGTHNGLRDICEHVGMAFPRLRLGVRGQHPWRDLADYVLSPFTVDELPIARQLVERAADAVESALRDGLETAMLRFNGPSPADDVGGCGR